MLDYDISFESLVRQYSWAFIRQGKVMDLLHCAGLGRPPGVKIPSWIPDWTTQRQNSLRSLSGQGMPCAASRLTEPRIDYDQATNDFELRVHGVKVDTITAVSTTSNLPQELVSYLNEIDEMVRLASPTQYEDLRWQVPIAGALKERIKGHDMHDSYMALCEYIGKKPKKSKNKKRQRKGVGEILVSTRDKDALWLSGQNYFLALQENLAGWKFVLTGKGYLGVAPPQARKGDRISVFDRGVVPFLLIRSKAFKGSFYLVGECYIHGFMNGEGCNLGLPDKLIRLR